MKFSCSTTINAPRDFVVKCFISEAVMRQYQDDFIGREQHTGTPWEVGSTAIITYKKFLLKETIISNKLPCSFQALYEHKHMDNTMLSTFTEKQPGTTHIEQLVHYTTFKNLLPKMMASLFPGLFKKQVQKWQDQFKEVVEKSYNSKSPLPA